jgi:xanthine dehydrogenase accessory factor
LTGAIEEAARRLGERGEAYVLATVVWRRAPSSGRVGSRAVIGLDGHVHGWIAGACAEPTIVAEARRALSEGSPRLVFLGPPEELDAHRRDGVLAVPIQCQSEGALEVYVEPVFPQPLVVAVGRSPAAETLVRLAAALGWRTALVDDGGSSAEHPGVDRVLTTLDLEAAGVDEGSFVVVATQGHYDEDALERALGTPAAYVGLVASARRAATVLDYLRAKGLPEDQVARVRAPAGLDLGSVGTEEIAVAILAEVVALRAGGELGRPRTEPPPSEVHEAVDPVCGMTVDVATARHVASYEGRTYYFCSAGCRATFEANPAEHTTAPE